MENIIYYKIIEYLDIHNISQQYNISIYNNNLDTLIKIVEINNNIEIKKEIAKNKYYFSNYVIKEYNRIFNNFYNCKILQSNMSIKNIIYNHKMYYNLRAINKEIINKFYKNGRDKILQSRLSIKNIIYLPDYNFEPYLLKFYFRDIDYLYSKNVMNLFLK
jgi:hypothetical protein